MFSVEKFPVLKGQRITENDLKKWPHLNDINFPMVADEQITLLIGQDVPVALTPIEVRAGKAGEPFATRTVLGWTLNGPIGHGKTTIVSNFVQRETDSELSAQVENLWKFDQVEDMQQMSVNDKHVIDIWDRTTVVTEGHYEMVIPFKNENPNLPNNISIAESRLESLERRLRKDTDLYEKYKAEIHNLLDKGYAEKVPQSEMNRDDGKVWYLPHHGVKNINKPDKLRIVYDCSAEFRGTSLNKEVLQGPDMTNNLLGVALRFREGPVALMGDIDAMFHQVLVSPSDKDVLRFLWWKNDSLDNETEVYRMKVHFFGGVWCPICANYALNRTANDNHHSFDADVVNTVKKNFYVDDCLKSVSDSDQGKHIVTNLKQLLQNGGFRIAKWVSNSRPVIESVQTEDRAKSVQSLDLDQSTLPVERALGVEWNTERDQIGFSIKPKDRPFTRRGLISVLSSVYDPMGLVSPVVLQAKKIFQRETKMQKPWDSPLEPANIERWI